MSAPQFTLTVPKNTPIETPAELNIHLMAGRVNAVSVGFHNGANNLVHVTLNNGLKQLLPGIEGQSLKWNGYVFTFPLLMIIGDVGLTIVARGWSPNTLYQHDVEFWFHMITQDEIQNFTPEQISQYNISDSSFL